MVARWRMRLFWALILAIATAWGIKAYLGSLQETEPVVVAAKDIPARATITPDMLKVIEVSSIDRSQLAPDAFQSTAELVGRNARRAIAAGEVLRNRPSDLTEPGEISPGTRTGEGALADFLPPDARAMTIKADQEAVLGSHLRAGDRVDLVFTSKTDSTGGVYSSLLLQQVQVLDIQRPPEGEPDQNLLVTLLVTVEQAVDLALAKRTGSIDLVLNPPDPGSPIGPTVTSPLKFIGSATVMPAAAQPPEPEKPGNR